MNSEKSPKHLSQSYLAVVLLAIVLALLFWRCFLPEYVQFSNDGPVGQQSPRWFQLPAGFTGMWDDMNYLGLHGGQFFPDVTAMIKWWLGPVGLSKFYVPLALFILGSGAWMFFRALKLAPVAAVIGTFAVALNGTWFSTACWGVASQQIAAGFDFMALALVVSIVPTMPSFERFIRLILAGMAIGVNVMEAADIGAMFSMVIAAYVFYHAFAVTEGSLVGKVSRGFARVLIIALSAGLIAASAVSILVGTQIKGVAGTQQDEATKQAHWDFATQWSFPKRETLALVVPGLFGYRMDEPDGGNYWGVGGRDPSWWHYLENGKQDAAPDPRGLRQAGGGCYAGVMAVLLVVWAAFQAFRKKSVFTVVEQKLVRFWVATLIVCLLFAYGRYAPFFQFVYALPYASTIRNPGKFLHIFTLAMTILCAYGIHALSRGYLETTLANISGSASRFKSWWGRACAFEKRWTMGCIAFIAISLVGWLIYASNRPALESYLQENGFNEVLAPMIASFSIRQVGWYVLFLSSGIGLMIMILSGTFAGSRAKFGGILLGCLLVADLGRSDMHWVKFVNYKEKLATDSVVEFLRKKPYEHRVAILPFRVPQQYDLAGELYSIEWAQHHFPYFNIQSLNVIQLPRTPADYAAFEAALNQDGNTNTVFRIVRRWQLTNTRYLIGPAPFLDILNTQLDAKNRPFRLGMTFDVVPKASANIPSGLTRERLNQVMHMVSSEQLTARETPGGDYAIFDFTAALPRVKLYRNWHVATNDPAMLKLWAAEADKRVPADWGSPLSNLDATDQATLYEMASEPFDPAQTVLLPESISAPSNTVATGTNSDIVTFTSYAPKDIKLHAEAGASTVLLLNDKYDPSWQVWVDGKQEKLLRCNFFMRGVALTAGKHDVEFLFKPDVHMLYVTLAGIGLGIVLLGVVIVQSRRRK